MQPSDTHEVRPFPRSRRVVLDIGRADRKRHAMHGLIEVDVTRARRLIAAQQGATGEQVSFTAFVVACLATAVAAEPDVHAYRDLRDRLILFDDVDVCLSVEVEAEGRSFPLAHVIRAANERSVAEIQREIRRVKRAPDSSPSAKRARAVSLFLLLPAFVRAWSWRTLRRFPHRQKALEGTVGVTAIGMFGAGGGWGIGDQVHTLDVVVGGIAERPAIVDGKVVPREFLALTLSFDHDVVDGAPAARFAATLRRLLGSGDGLERLLPAEPPERADAAS